MNKRVIGSAFCLVALQAAAAALPVDEQQITRSGAQNSVAGPEQFFTGRVRIDPVWPADEDVRGGRHLPFGAQT